MLWMMLFKFYLAESDKLFATFTDCSSWQIWDFIVVQPRRNTVRDKPEYIIVQERRCRESILYEELETCRIAMQNCLIQSINQPMYNIFLPKRQYCILYFRAGESGGIGPPARIEYWRLGGNMLKMGLFNI